MKKQTVYLQQLYVVGGSVVAMKQPEIENSSIKDPAGHIDHQQGVGQEGTEFSLQAVVWRENASPD